MPSDSPTSSRRTALKTLFDETETERFALSPSEPGPSAYVVEEIETAGIFRDEPVSILCPGCGEVVEKFPHGLPAVIRRFTAQCSQCGHLKRWSAVTIATAYVEYVSLDDLERVVTHYWEQRMWGGIETGGKHPRTREYCTLFDEQAADFGWDWRLSCPLCRRTLAEIGSRYFDFHHWRPDAGVCICRECHDVIGRQERDATVDWRAQELGLLDKHDVQIARLTARDVVVAGADSLESVIHRLIDRYRIPYSERELECLLTQTLGDSAMREQILDDDVWQDLTSPE